MANEIVKEILHPDNNDNIDIYPKTSYDQVEGRPNLENGTGKDSLVQKYSGEVDVTHYASSTTGESDVCLGEANTSSGKRNIIGGKLNENTSSNTLIVGLRNTVSGNHSIIGGTDNNVTGYAGVTAGTNNNIKGYNCLGSGTENDISGAESIFNGYKNKQTGSQSFILGNQNTSEFKQTFIAGVKNIASRERQYIFGSWAKENSNAVFIVSDRKGPSDAVLTDNNFMVMADGRVKVYGEPVNDEDVVRLKDLKDSVGLYMHNIKLKNNNEIYAIQYPSSKNTHITNLTELKALLYYNTITPVMVIDSGYNGVGNAYLSASSMNITMWSANGKLSIPLSGYTVTDTVIKL